MVNENPLLSPSTLPYGLPDYSAIRPEHYLPAFEEAFAAQKREIGAITMVRSMPTFENTMVALETQRQAARRCLTHVLHGLVRRRDARDPGDRGRARATDVGAP